MFVLLLAHIALGLWLCSRINAKCMPSVGSGCTHIAKFPRASLPLSIHKIASSVDPLVVHRPSDQGINLLDNHTLSFKVQVFDESTIIDYPCNGINNCMPLCPWVVSWPVIECCDGLLLHSIPIKYVSYLSCLKHFLIKYPFVFIGYIPYHL